MVNSEKGLGSQKELIIDLKYSKVGHIHYDVFSCK